MGACMSSVPKVEEPPKPAEPVVPEQPHVIKKICTVVVSTVGRQLYYIGFMTPEMNFIGRPEGTDYWSLSRCEKNWLIYLFCLRTLVWAPLAIPLICIAIPFALLAFMWG
jgi:hypothetical protein